MTRKRYDIDEVKDEEWEKKQELKELEEQKEYEIQLKIKYEKENTFIEINFDQLYDMFENLMNNRIDPFMLDRCKFITFGNFIENPSQYNYENINYEKEIWYEQYKGELKSHFRALKRYNLFHEDNKNKKRKDCIDIKDKLRISYEQFKNFCFQNTNQK